MRVALTTIYLAWDGLVGGFSTDLKKSIEMISTLQMLPLHCSTLDAPVRLRPHQEASSGLYVEAAVKLDTSISR
ncbi:hypothetical protein RRF57_008855 [Xylaria bambusicola]|uniref:Uncharacterized protein n=1 Tax=Xylaria bambusicola TaxID=326684 RepID=A0AAN7ZBK4_9PEZI